MEFDFWRTLFLIQRSYINKRVVVILGNVIINTSWHITCDVMLFHNSFIQYFDMLNFLNHTNIEV